MIKVNEQITVLVNELNNFLKISHNTLNWVLNGMALARDLVSDEENQNVSFVIDKISNVLNIISGFKIEIKNINETEQVWLAWHETGTTEKYYYNNKENDLSEKMFNFILMSFDKKISQRLSIIEDSNNGYIYFCTYIKNNLHKIVADYMTN